MTNPNAPKSRTPLAGGFILAASMMLGVAGGMAAGQVTIGFLAGLGVGILVAVGIWLMDR